MLLSLQARMAVRLRNITNVAEDLARELRRAKCPATSVIHDMAAFIKAEADTALSTLTKPPRRERS